jgi:hypothetical protein
MFVNSELQPTYLKQCLGMFTKHFSPKFYVRSSSDSLVADMKLKETECTLPRKCTL